MERKTAKEILNFYWGKEHTNYTVIDAMHEFARQEIALAKEAWEKERDKFAIDFSIWLDCQNRTYATYAEEVYAYKQSLSTGE